MQRHRARAEQREQGRAEQSRAARAGQSRAQQRAADGEWLGSERREAGTGGSSAAPVSGGVGAVRRGGTNEATNKQTND